MKTKKKILIVDDDWAIIGFLAHFISKKNFEAELAENGEEAYEKIIQSPPDLIISDILMPRMDGFELYRRLQENPEIAGIPFIFLSSKTDPADQLQGFRMGANEYLTKPFDLEHLFKTINKVLANSGKAKFSREKIDFSGNLGVLFFEDMIQLIEINQKTGELVFTNSQDEIFGSIFFKDGAVIHAVTDKLDGEEAFYDLSPLKNAYAKFFTKEVDAPKTISSQTMALLFESARMVDEANTISSLLTDWDVPLYVKSRDIQPDIKDKLGADWTSKIIRMIENKKTPTEISNNKWMSRIRAESILVGLLKAGLVQEKHAVQHDPESPNYMDVELLDQLKEIEASSLTGILEIDGRPVKSIIHFDNGLIDQAFHGTVKGKKALFRIFSEKGGDFKFKSKAIIFETAIQSDLASLINEANKEIEFKKYMTDDKLDCQVVILSGAWERIVQDEENNDLSNTLRIASEKKKIRDIIEISPLTDQKTINNLIYMKKVGLIKIEKNR